MDVGGIGIHTNISKYGMVVISFLYAGARHYSFYRLWCTRHYSEPTAVNYEYWHWAEYSRIW